MFHLRFILNSPFKLIFSCLEFLYLPKVSYFLMSFVTVFTVSYLIVVKVRDAAVVELFLICGDWSKFALICWKTIHRLTTLDLIKQNAFNFSFVLKVLLEQRLIPILLHTLRSQVKLIRLLHEQILLVSYFVFDV